MAARYPFPDELDLAGLKELAEQAYAGKLDPASPRTSLLLWNFAGYAMNNEARHEELSAHTEEIADATAFANCASDILEAAAAHRTALATDEPPAKAIPWKSIFAAAKYALKLWLERFKPPLPIPTSDE